MDGLPHVAVGDVRRLAQELPSSIEHLPIHLPWHSLHETVERVAQLQAGRELRVQLHVMANTVDEVSAYQGYGVPVAHGPAPMYVSEYRFYPEDQRTHASDAAIRSTTPTYPANRPIRRTGNHDHMH